MNETDQMMAIGGAGLFCFVVFGIAAIAVVVWMFRSKPGAVVQQQQQQQQQYVPPAPVVQQQQQQSPEPAFHLSVIALAFDGYFRGQVETLLNAAATSVDPMAMRIELVQRVARSMLGVEPQWRHFGYGEKDLADLTEAQQSYTNATADFRTRTAMPEDGGALAVLTLVLCTRGRRLGVDRLDTREQVKTLLLDRLQVDAASLLGAEVMWAPPSGGLTEFAVKERFPEMHPLL